MSEFENKLDKYAETVVKVGLNVQKGQDVYISVPVYATNFTRKLVKHAYLAGARQVLVDYVDDEVDLLKYQLASDEGLKAFPSWKTKGILEMADNNAAFLSIRPKNPELLKDIDPDRVAMVDKVRRIESKEYSQNYISTGRISWTLLSYPSPEWAKLMFPKLTEEEAVEKLWDAMFEVTRINQENPVDGWKEHIEGLETRAELLNEKKYKKLHYKAPGTDLTIELHKDHKWMCANFTNLKGTKFVPNIPTEEVFTIPHKDGVNGTVTSTKPLVYSGKLINQFSLTFKEGKVVDFKAEEGYDILKNILSIDEGAKFLGEVALVPYDSPISNSNLVFYDTLYDENASCHIALGNALQMCIENVEEKSKEDIDAMGFNRSLTHVDFMIGSAELDIDGETEDGLVEPIFRAGNWVI
ncbi:aminopeptidase [Chengkuizengella axinellae]|uniref:Aminopeptidase n=1 Tax=Chengkuizengella axinellae TaxID=3064388 RepID=A0ABT9J170_9BACL|nr:aminopeptidase [Chengkuizengella sp. 2205SS18-9]MDP5275361.1 aminopeptidase [Chengkuizengella sp. 2205SS18-9]